MDGALVLTSDRKRILYANAQLMPNQSISTFETGTRHRTAQRVAKQTNKIAIAISQRRNIITVYRGEQKYVVEEISKIFTKANQALQTLEKYKSVLDQAILNLNSFEFKDMVTIYEGRNRQIRRMFDYINHPVLDLKRVQIGNYKMEDNLKSGEYVLLKSKDLDLIRGKYDRSKTCK